MSTLPILKYFYRLQMIQKKYEGVTMLISMICAGCPDWVKDRELDNEEWVHDRWGDCNE